MSLVEANRSELEKLGEFVIRANASTGWFAVFPRKVEACRSQARALARPDFHLLVYRTVNADERDHWAIPFSLVAQEFTAASLTHSDVNGVDRWNCTFRNGVLHVTHTGRDLDSSPFYRQPLIIEARRSDAALPEEVAEDEAFAEGNVTRISINRYERDAGARIQCIAIRGPVSAVCGFDFAVVYGQGMRGFSHVHHIAPLHQIRGSYVVNPKTDLVPVSPNCHAVIHSRREPLAIEEVRQLVWRSGDQSGPAKPKLA